jgi:hypothetical protein
MELRARIRPNLRHVGLMAAAAALLVPAAAGTSTADAAKRAPVVKRVTPKKVFVGETLTIRGRYFRPGIGKNTVAFRRKGAKVVLVRAGKSTRKLIRVKLPKRLEKLLPVRSGTPVATRLQVRVMTTRFGRRYTSRAKSPIVGPEKPPAPPVPPTTDPNADCDGDGVINRLDADDDNDLLSDAEEAALNKLLDPCKADTDGDGVDDGYEYQSARDLNDDRYSGASTPYPRKLPFPNPLDGEDANIDHDGDTLTLKDEFDLWNFTIANGTSPRSRSSLSYSAGEQFSVNSGSGRRTPTLAAAPYKKQDDFLDWAGDNGYGTVELVNPGSTVNVLNDGVEWFAGGPSYPLTDLDRDWDLDPDGSPADQKTYYDDGNGWLDDAERDEDADGLPNQWESTGCMTRGYWDGLYSKETKYYLAYAPLRLDDPDSDGDGVRDGADDQDHDGVPNVMECSRSLALGAAHLGDLKDPPTYTPGPPAPWRSWQGFVNPFNPCLPHRQSETCKQHVIIGGSVGKWAPFNPDEKYYLILN